LCQTILTHANLEAASFHGSHYGELTQFPAGFAAHEAGAIDDAACSEPRFFAGCERAHGVEAPSNQRCKKRRATSDQASSRKNTGPTGFCQLFLREALC
jgi:hypothetical protein